MSSEVASFQEFYKFTVATVLCSLNYKLFFSSTDSPSISLGVGAGSSLLESCGICGTQSGQLLSLNGSIATTPSDRQVFVESYRVPAAEQSLRPMRAECSKC